MLFLKMIWVVLQVGFSDTDISIDADGGAGGKLLSLASVDVATGSLFIAEVGELYGEGSLTVSFPEGAAVDRAGNLAPAGVITVARGRKLFN